MSRKSCVFLTLAAITAVCQVQASDGPITAQTPMRTISLPPPGIIVPPDSFQESPQAQKACMPLLNRQIVDRAGRKYLDEDQWRALFDHGRAITQADYQWGRALVMHARMERLLRGNHNEGRSGYTQEQIDRIDWGRRKPPLAKLPDPPLPPALRRDLDHNFAVLLAQLKHLRLAEQVHDANMVTMELNILRAISTHSGPLEEKLSLMVQLDEFLHGITACRNAQVWINRILDNASRDLWSVVEVPHKLDDEAQAQWERGSAASAALRQEFPEQVQQLIDSLRPTLLERIRKSKTVADLVSASRATFGNHRIREKVMSDSDIGKAYDARLDMLKQQEYAASIAKDRAETEGRAAQRMKLNPAPDRAEVLAFLLNASLTESMLSFPGSIGSTLSKSYVISREFFGNTVKQMEVEIDIEDLACKPKGRAHHCSYTQVYRRTAYGLLGAMASPGEVKRSKGEGVFQWKMDGLRSIGEVDVTYVQRTSGGGRGASTSGRGSADRDSLNEGLSDMAKEREERDAARRQSYDANQEYRRERSNGRCRSGDICN